MIAALELLRALAPDEIPDSIEVRGGLYEEFHRRIDENDWEGMAQAYLVEGAAGGGKTFALANLADRLCRLFPGLNILILRNKRVDLVASWQRTYEEEVLDADDPYDQQILAGRSREDRSDYKYPVDKATGLQSVITLGGMNIWERYRSTQYHIIWIVEGSEVSRANTMGVVRALRPQRKRGFLKRKAKRVGQGQMPFKPFLLVDTNPDAEEHHLNVWANEGRFKRVKVTIKDNPLFWDRHHDCPTPDGKAYLELLTNNTDGYVYERLVEGKWSTAIGAMFPMYDPRLHLFSGGLDWSSGAPMLEFDVRHPVLGESVELVDVLASVDWGTRNAGTLQVWGLDREARLFLLWEVYHSERDIDWWAEKALEAIKRFRVSSIICDTDKPDNVVTFNKAIHRAFKSELGEYRAPTTRAQRDAMNKGAAKQIARTCRKNTTKRSNKSNWELIRWALKKDDAGIPHVFFSMNAMRHTPDPELVRAQLPHNLTQEIPRARWAPFEAGKTRGIPKEEMDPAAHNHGLTAMAYAVAEVYGRDLAVSETKAEFKRRYLPGSWGFHFGEDVDEDMEPEAGGFILEDDEDDGWR